MLTIMFKLYKTENLIDRMVFLLLTEISCKFIFSQIVLAMVNINVVTSAIYNICIQNLYRLNSSMWVVGH